MSHNDPSRALIPVRKPLGHRARLPLYAVERVCMSLFITLFKPSHLSFLTRTPLYDHAVATFDGFVYAVAGSVEGKASLLLQDKVQCYNPHLNHWEFVGAMQEARAKTAAAEHEGLIYVSGKNS